MVERGAKIILDAVLSNNAISDKDKLKTMELYNKIINTLRIWNEKGIALSKRKFFLSKAGIPEERIQQVLQ